MSAPTDSPTLKTFFETTYLPLRLARRSPATAESYLGTISLYSAWHAKTFAAAPAPADVTQERVALWLAQATTLDKRPISNATYNRHLRTLLCVLRLAKRRGVVPASAALDWDDLKQTEAKREPDCWTLEEFARILTAAAAAETYTDVHTPQIGPWPAELWMPALILTIFSTGLRISAVMQLESAHFDATGGTIKAFAETQKHAADQTFALVPAAAQALARIRPAGRAKIFGDWPLDGYRRPWKGLNRYYKHVLNVAGLSTTRRDVWHKLRRMFATQIAIHAGVEAARILLGHSSLSVTARYIDRRQLPVLSPAAILPAIELPAALRVVG